MTTLTETEAAANLREAREILASLVNKRSDHERKIAELGRERSAIAFDAHQGDARARKRLDALHLEAAKADSEFLSLDAAVSEAQSRVKDAEAAVGKAEAAAKAERVLSLLPGLREHGKVLDEAAAEVLQHYSAFQNIIRTVRELTDTGRDVVGIARERAVVPSEQLLRVGCKRALISALIGTDLEVEKLAPGERHSFVELIDGWAASIQWWANRRLPESKTHKHLETEEA